MLTSSILKFLKDLRKNNNRPWFESNRNQYLAAKEDFELLVENLLPKLSRVDRRISGLEVKDCTFRIFKDIRFSKDKTPYKTNMGAGFNPGGKKVHFPGYYFHLEPGGKSFFGGGMWLPMAPELKKIRQEIDYNFKEFHQIITIKSFFSLYGALEDEASLTRPPKGYDEDNPALHFLKMKSFVVSCRVEDPELTSTALVPRIIRGFTCLKPFIDFLSRAIEE
ncbi:MAG: DUF2461 domain-containing protein [Chitinophagaceae bacterium]